MGNTTRSAFYDEIFFRAIESKTKLNARDYQPRSTKCTTDRVIPKDMPSDIDDDVGYRDTTHEENLPKAQEKDIPKDENSTQTNGKQDESSAEANVKPVSVPNNYITVKPRKAPDHYIDDS
ncbi:uncharacterized protein LOC126976097 isoform X2 [Leptidea sinapis]|uniref:uncharacterized protein LOC126976097 isoform X2 n=1 Tax=Leptidea sinapis TaxID=189913 RepID=UPI0021C44282|nr:uncharacterized protein LOC126976097 isoform X2 [Leptidea sinapis]